MASNELSDDCNVSVLFDEGLQIFDKLSESDEPNSSSVIQCQVTKATALLEETTKIVSIVGMFSTNESIEEISTSDVKFFLLPALLGVLTLKLTTASRKEIVSIAEIYIKDFLKRCKNYSIIDFDLPEVPAETEKKNAKEHDIAQLVSKRNAKLESYKRKKEFERQLTELRTQMSTDDETKRTFYLTLIKSLANQALEELDSIEAEKPLIEHMEHLRSTGKTFDEEARGARPPVQPLRPIIITRDEMQKKIYGAGYPSLPTMTVQEFYDKRAADGEFPDPNAAKQPTLPAWEVEELAARKASEEEAETERREEEDDEESLAKKRGMDEYKDTHRRGWGNRMNRS